MPSTDNEQVIALQKSHGEKKVDMSLQNRQRPRLRPIVFEQGRSSPLFVLLRGYELAFQDSLIRHHNGRGHKRPGAHSDCQTNPACCQLKTSSVGVFPDAGTAAGGGAAVTRTRPSARHCNHSREHAPSPLVCTTVSLIRTFRLAQQMMGVGPQDVVQRASTYDMWVTRRRFVSRIHALHRRTGHMVYGNEFWSGPRRTG